MTGQCKQAATEISNNLTLLVRKNILLSGDNPHLNSNVKIPVYCELNQKVVLKDLYIVQRRS